MDDASSRNREFICMSIYQILYIHVLQHISLVQLVFNAIHVIDRKYAQIYIPVMNLLNTHSHYKLNHSIKSIYKYIVYN